MQRQRHLQSAAIALAAFLLLIGVVAISGHSPAAEADRVSTTRSSPPTAPVQGHSDQHLAAANHRAGVANVYVAVVERHRIQLLTTAVERQEQARQEAARAEARRQAAAQREAEQAEAPEAPSTRQAPAPAPSSSAGGSVWDRLAQCESGGNWAINTGNGYYGGLQFSASSWRAVGGTGLPHQASRETQIAMGERLRASGGWGHWPACSRKLGLR